MGLNAEVSNLTNFDIFEKVKFDFVILNNVLEHLRDPVFVIKKIKKFLKKEGVLFIEVPNDFNKFQVSGKIINNIKKKWWISPPAHLNYFSHDTLEIFLKRLGFIVKKKIRVSFRNFFIIWENYVKIEI